MSTHLTARGNKYSFFRKCIIWHAFSSKRMRMRHCWFPEACRFIPCTWNAMELLIGLCMILPLSALFMQAQMDDNDEQNDFLWAKIIVRSLVGWNKLAKANWFLVGFAWVFCIFYYCWCWPGTTHIRVGDAKKNLPLAVPQNDTSLVRVPWLGFVRFSLVDHAHSRQKGPGMI